MILHFSHIGLTDGRTFMIPFGSVTREPALAAVKAAATGRGRARTPDGARAEISKDSKAPAVACRRRIREIPSPIELTSDIVCAMVRVGMHEAKSQLSRLVDLAERGEEIVIQRSGRPVARLVAIERRRPVAEAFGALRGQIELADDFDELPPDLIEHFR